MLSGFDLEILNRKVPKTHLGSHHSYLYLVAWVLSQPYLLHVTEAAVTPSMKAKDRYHTWNVKTTVHENGLLVVDHSTKITRVEGSARSRRLPGKDMR